MRLIFADGAFTNKQRPFKVIQLDGTWYVVAEGFLCQVETSQEGVELIEKLKAKRLNAQQDR